MGATQQTNPFKPAASVLSLIVSLVLYLGAAPSPSHADSIVRSLFYGIPGPAITNLLVDPCFPNSPDAAEVLPNLLEAGSGNGDNYGSLIRGWITAPQTGNYTFWIVSDDTSELWFSTNEVSSLKQWCPIA